MTVMSTSYSTIDEAWGDLTGSKQRKDPNRRKKHVADPICELYESKAGQSFNDTDLVRYANEYNDKYRYQRTTKTPPMTYEEQPREPPVKQVTVQKPPSSTNRSLFEKQFEIKLPPLYDGGDECPLIRPVSSEVSSESAVADEWDQYLTPQRRGSVVAEEESYSRPPPRVYLDTEQEQIVKKYTPQPQSENYFETLDENFGYQEEIKSKYNSLQVMDLILYIVSGVILIFVMEQFVRIGINMQ